MYTMNKCYKKIVSIVLYIPVIMINNFIMQETSIETKKKNG